MKQLFIICALFAGTTTIQAQSVGMTHGQWEENESHHHKAKTGHFNEFAGIEMSVDNNLVTFSGLPAVKKPAYAVVTNAEGEFIKQTRIAPDQNTMDIKRLHTGLYFVTIVYKNESKIAFTIKR